MNIDQANTQATQQMMEARPVLTGLGIARDVLPNMHENLILHAGPPITWDRMSGPLRGAIIGALIFEGRATTATKAQELATSGEIEFAPCHHYGAGGPMAGATSPSMAVYIVENQTHGNLAFSNLNEGYGKVLRYGAYQDDVQERLRWMHDIMAPTLKAAIEQSGGIDIRAMLAEALHMGDEGHNRNKAGSVLFTKALAPHIARAAPNGDVAAEIIQALGDNALSFLNPVMAACKAMCDAAHGVEESTIITTMARNGTDFGIRLSGLGDQWFTAPAQVPDGLYFPSFTSAHANADIGDSTITETAGIGGFAMAAAPAIVNFISGKPSDALDTTMEMYEITFTEHTSFTIPALDFRGTPTGIDLRKVIGKDTTPRINTGIAHMDAGVGQIGAGLVRPPMETFEQALVAYAQKYDV